MSSHRFSNDFLVEAVLVLAVVQSNKLNVDEVCIKRTQNYKSNSTDISSLTTKMLNVVCGGAVTSPRACSDVNMATLDRNVNGLEVTVAVA